MEGLLIGIAYPFSLVIGVGLLWCVLVGIYMLYKFLLACVGWYDWDKIFKLNED